MQTIFRLLCLSAAISMQVACAGAPIQPQPGDTPRERYLAGMQKLADGDLAAAETAFDRAFELDKRAPDGSAGRAFLELERKRYAQAIRNADRALDRDPAFLDAAAAKGLAIASRAKGDDWLDRAVAVLAGAIQRDPAHARCLFSLGEVYFMAADYPRAREAYQQVTALDGDFADKARAQSELAEQLERAGSLSARAREIALAETVSRGDLCVLLLDCLDIASHLETQRPSLYAEIFDAEGRRRQSPKVFAEVSGNRWREAILDVIVLGLPSFGLYSDGRFYPDRLVTRKELAMVIQDALVLVFDDRTHATRFVGTPSPFRDVHPDSYAYNAIRLSIDRGYLAPQSEREFDPDSTPRGIVAVLAFAAAGREMAH